jgi:hypothetical protein
MLDGNVDDDFGRFGSVGASARKKIGIRWWRTVVEVEVEVMVVVVVCARGFARSFQDPAARYLHALCARHSNHMAVVRVMSLKVSLFRVPWVPWGAMRVRLMP